MAYLARQHRSCAGITRTSAATLAKEEHRALLNAVRKLGELGEQLGPPHMKPLKGIVRGLRELCPRQGQSDWRAIYRRAPDFYATSPSIGTRTLLR